MLERFSLKDRIAIVTGASKGIGQGIAIGLAQAGAHLAITARGLDHLAETEAALAATGREVLSAEYNVKNRGQFVEVVQKTRDRFGRIDILVNNVGGQFVTPFRKISDGGWDAVVNLNLTSVYQCCHAVYPVMYEQKSGVVINMSSMAAHYPSLGIAPYSASKAAIESLTKVLALEWARYGIRVNAICPGAILTAGGLQIWSDPARREEIANAIPLGRWGTPEDVAASAVFLASDAASYISGAVLDVFGGPVRSDR